jgi:hypothetical protein
MTRNANHDDKEIAGDFTDNRACRYNGHLSEQDMQVYGEPTEEMKSEVAESIRQMDASLGG